MLTSIFVLFLFLDRIAYISLVPYTSLVLNLGINKLLEHIFMAQILILHKDLPINVTVAISSCANSSPT